MAQRKKNSGKVAVKPKKVSKSSHSPKVIRGAGKSAAAIKEQTLKAKFAASSKFPAVESDGSKLFFSVRLFHLSKWYAAGALLLLLLTTVVWSLLGARLEQSNADQIINTYLFGHWDVFRNASFPGAHTFLIKWPLFWLASVLVPTNATFALLTGLVSLTTVGFLAYVLYRIDRRPLVFGTLCLALAALLISVPPQPYAGGLLPVNMAMITTRNLEYVWYILSLIALIKWPRIRSVPFWLGVLLLGLLAASDKLFATLTIGGAVLGLVCYGALRRTRLMRLHLLWLVSGVAAFALASLITWLINASGLTHISSQLTATPYAATHHAKDVVLGMVFGGLSIGTNFGANPAFDAAVLRTIPSLALGRLAGLAGAAYVVNGLLFVAGIVMAARLLFGSLFHPKDKEPRLDTPVQLSLLLIWASFAAFAAYVGTNHYFFVDARYLGIILFAVVISAATYLRDVTLRRRTVVIVAAVLLVGIGSGLVNMERIFRADRAALSGIDARNELVARALKNHPVDVLVGDYWRVMPIKDVSPQDLAVLPLDACGQRRTVLSSTSWQPDLTKRSFAYLLSLDKSLTNYRSCSLEEVIAEYGRPNASLTVAGTLEHPTELLLYYDRGAKRSAPLVMRPVSTVLPISPEQLPHSMCEGMPTIMNVVAHQDDDLLFISPSLLHDVDAGHCIRTVYVTAGDGGGDQFYWQAREHGSEAAYSKMLNVPDDWVQRTVKLAKDEFVTVVNPRGNQKIALIFMHLPDGNVSGQGFKNSNFESLAGLEQGRIKHMHTIDRQSAYSADGVAGALTLLMQTYKPTEVRTQATYNESQTYQDHSDHMAVGRYAAKAYAAYGHPEVPINYYYGYPIHGMVPNVSGDDLRRKVDAFLAYAAYDGAACHFAEQCESLTNYGAYLRREYGYDAQ